MPVKTVPIIPSTKPAVASPEALPYAAIDFILPFTPKIIATIPQASKIKLRPLNQNNATDTQPITNDAIDIPRPSLGFLGGF